MAAQKERSRGLYQWSARLSAVAFYRKASRTGFCKRHVSVHFNLPCLSRLLFLFLSWHGQKRSALITLQCNGNGKILGKKPTPV